MEIDLEKMIDEITKKAHKDCAFAIWRIYNDDNITSYDNWIFKPFTWLFIRMRKKIHFIKKRHRIRTMCYGCRNYGDCLIKYISKHTI